MKKPSRFFTALVPFIILPCLLPGQLVRLAMNSRIDGNQMQNSSIRVDGGCETYLIDGETHYSSFGRLELIENSTYRFLMDFAAFHDFRLVTPTNYSSLGYRLYVNPARPDLIKVRSEPSLSENRVQFHLLTSSPQETSIPVHIGLVGPSGEEVAGAEYKMRVIPTPDPDNPLTTSLPQIIHRVGTLVNLQNQDTNTNEQPTSIDISDQYTEHQVVLTQNQSYLLSVNLIKGILVDDTRYEISITAEEDYGWRVAYAWEGPELSLKPRTENGLYAYLQTGPATKSQGGQVEISQPNAKMEVTTADPSRMQRLKVNPAAKEKASVPAEAPRQVRPVPADPAREIMVVQPQVAAAETLTVVGTVDSYLLYIDIFNEFGENINRKSLRIFVR